MKRKIIKTVMLSTLVIGLIEIFGYKIVVFFSNSFQQNVCINQICIKKPNDWLPMVVKENNISKILNVVDRDYLLSDVGDKYLSEYDNGLILSNNEKRIIIKTIKGEAYKKVASKKTYNDIEYYIHSIGNQYMVINTSKKLMMTLFEYDEKIIFNFVMNE